MISKKLHGTGVALVTPFDNQGEIDFQALKKLLRHTSQGVDYYVVMGTTGESATLSKEEKKEVLQFVIANNIKKLPIVYGIGGNHTQGVVDEIRSTNLTSVDALLSVSPYYNKPSQEGIYQHFVAVANASPIPIILYNVPGRTASNLTAETSLRLAKHKNIIGIKEASGNLEQCMKIAKEKSVDFLLISGDDMLTLSLYAIGGEGVISVLANAYPVTFKKIKEYMRTGKLNRAQQEQFKLLEINAPMYEEGNPVGLKHLLKTMNIGNGDVRLPLVAASSALQKKIETLVKKK
ncbi:MAG: 4-hydroxy-tetrahydrodipicolinate synthase [Cytophagales bacterium]|jgi:4-hydroxy-tetrahydrodipicolinate synthase|nr:4-hydroxy-tetrahydrodipicolinate synthase [Cytophagales bacterium]MCA6366346.1 4-hydroxy-tetrahydrodipicolinate synthase [Cytophagales bacterium]MCA6371145.1 4-hydroxy-tetrahydrodipicolinate synthase [Cytophagales bacterium]MCA6374730.1 4-hydroxy-tetrahydrodipicolinate synthase [Cytophagales bacterium]MCA6384599.1 4-hydroxy-tetrahydrodipicolinate synthase [Cytophagales bacterium]